MKATQNTADADFAYDADGQGEFTQANAALGFRKAAVIVRRDAFSAYVGMQLAKQLAGIAVKAGWLTSQQMTDVTMQATAENEAQPDGEATFEPLGAMLERVADLVEQAAPTDVVPLPTASRTRAGIAARLREIAAELAALQSPFAGMALVEESTTLEYEAEERGWVTKAQTDAIMGTAPINNTAFVTALGVLADAIEQGVDAPLPTATPAVSLGAQAVAQQAFGGAQPHRFGREVM